MKVAFINCEDEKIEFKEISASGPIELGLEVHEKNECWKYPPLHPKNYLCFGCGPLAHTTPKLVGSARLVFVAKSPLWRGLWVSTMGGASLSLVGAGIDGVVLEEQCKDGYLIIAIREDEFKFYKMSESELRKIFFEGYNGKLGVWAMQEFAYEKFKNMYSDNDKVRVFVCGPASLTTNFGVICSTVIQNKKFRWGADDWAGRGGLGSVMLQAHKVAAIVIGGNKSKEIDFEFESIFEEEFGKKRVEVQMEKTEKYRYNAKLDTGGTFGVNMATLGIWLPFLNYYSSYLPREKRKEIYEKLVREHYLKQFNNEVIKTKSWTTCGESCLAVCKKVHLIKKKDYEPYTCNGPISGLFDMYSAEEVVTIADTYGFDAVEFGNVAGWILECLHRGILKKEDVGIDITPCFEPDEFLKDGIKCSYANSLIIRNLANMVVSNYGIGKLIAKGMRYACKELDKIFEHRVKEKGVSFSDLAVYTPFGESGFATPAPYWVIGLFAPLPIQVLTKTYYKRDLFEPREIGRKCAQRFIAEIGMDNAGWCRFHRGWLEPIISKIFERAKLKYNPKEICRRIAIYQKKCGLYPVYWESKRVKELVFNYLKDFQIDFKNNEKLDEWIKKYEENFENASKEYWNEIKLGIQEILEIEL